MMPFVKFLKQNFGHVYLHDALKPGLLFRCRARWGKVALIWCGDPFDTPRILNLGREIYARLKETCDICNGNEIKNMAGSERARAAMERQGMA